MEQNMVLKLMRVREGAIIPKQATAGSAGYDFYTPRDLTIAPGETVKIPTGIRACIEEAKQLGMSAWLYDEDRWPSGAAGGFVTSDLRYRERFMRLSPHFKSEYEVDKAAFDAKIAAGEKPLGYRLACYRITLKDGYLTDYQRLETVDHGEDDSVWYIY